MDKRKVIGILVGGIADDFTVQTCRGDACSAGEECGCRDPSGKIY